MTTDKTTLSCHPGATAPAPQRLQKSVAREYACCEAIRLAERKARTAKRIHRPKVAAERRRSLEWCRKAAPCAAGKNGIVLVGYKRNSSQIYVSRDSYIFEKGDVFFQ